MLSHTKESKNTNQKHNHTRKKMERMWNTVERHCLEYCLMAWIALISGRTRATASQSAALTASEIPKDSKPVGMPIKTKMHFTVHRYAAQCSTVMEILNQQCPVVICFFYLSPSVSQVPRHPNLVERFLFHLYFYCMMPVKDWCLIGWIISNVRHQPHTH